MKTNFFNGYGVYSLTQAFFYLGKYESVSIPRENVILIRDLETYLRTFGLLYSKIDPGNGNININLISAEKLAKKVGASKQS